MVSDIIVGVTGDVENFHVRPNAGKFRGQLVAIHVGHDHVGDQEMNGAVKISGEF